MIHAVTFRQTNDYDVKIGDREMGVLEKLVPLRQYCRTHEWPRLPQWHHWIYRKHPVASHCVKKIGGRYMVDLSALEKYIEQATLDE